MRLTELERTLLIANLDKINEWIQSIQSEIREEIKITLEDDTHNMILLIDDKRFYLKVGNINYDFDRTNSDSFYRGYIGKQAKYALKVICNWPVIKKCILEELDIQSKAIEMLINFEL